MAARRGRDTVALRLHREGRLRAWLGRRVGAGPEVGDRILRRMLHLAGLAVLAYFLLPPGFFVVLPTRTVLLLALLVVLLLEALRLTSWVEFPAMREYERGRPASFAWYAIALASVVLLFPETIAIATVVGVALLDPLSGELRRATGPVHRWYPAAPIAVYAVLAAIILFARGWSTAASLVGAIAAAIVAIAVEGPVLRVVDDDLAMTILPAVVLLGVGAAAGSLG